MSIRKTENFQAASKWACDQVEDRIHDHKFKVPDYTFADAFVGSLPGLEWVTNSGKLAHYNVPNPYALLLLRLGRINEGFYDVCVDICCSNVDAGTHLPEPLRVFVREVLKGQKHRPVAKGRPRQKDWLKEAFLFHLTKDIEKVFGLKLSRASDKKDEVDEISACDAVAEALTVCGCPTTYFQIKKLFHHESKEKFRKEMDIVFSIKDRSLDGSLTSQLEKKRLELLYVQIAHDVYPILHKHLI